jgi:hypothetical protein
MADPVTTPDYDELASVLNMSPDDLRAQMDQAQEEEIDIFDPFLEEYSTGKLFNGYKSRSDDAGGTAAEGKLRKDSLEALIRMPSGTYKTFRFQVGNMARGMYARIVVKATSGSNLRQAWMSPAEWERRRKDDGELNVGVGEIAIQVSQDQRFEDDDTTTTLKYEVDKETENIVKDGIWVDKEGKPEPVLRPSPVTKKKGGTRHIEMQVYEGSKSAKPPTPGVYAEYQRKTHAESREFGKGGKPEYWAAKKKEQEVDIRSELTSLYRLAPDDVKDLKTKLWMSGAFGQGDLEDMGDLEFMDQDTYTAAAQIMIEASRYYKAGTKITWRELLDKKAQNGPMADGKDPTPVHIELADSALLEETMRALAPEMAGKRMKPEEVRNFINGFHAQQTAAQTAGAGEGSSVAETPDYRAAAAQFIRQQYPDAVKANEWADRASEFDALLSETPVKAPEVQEVT